MEKPDTSTRAGGPTLDATKWHVVAIAMFLDHPKET
jgi:hypothetical protein